MELTEAAPLFPDAPWEPHEVCSPFSADRGRTEGQTPQTLLVCSPRPHASCHRPSPRPGEQTGTPGRGARSGSPSYPST